MKKNLSICTDILQKYPETTIGYVLISGVQDIDFDKFLPKLKEEALFSIANSNITLQNIADQPEIAVWRKIYADCGVKPKTYKSSIESLVRRFIEGKYNSIIPIVDLYNYISAIYTTPVGGYDFDKVIGNLNLRFSDDNESFIPLSGKVSIPITKQHIIYADEHKNDPVVCWLWNHKDSKRTMLSKEVNTALFIFDGHKDITADKLDLAMDLLMNTTKNAGAVIEKSGVLNKQTQSVELCVD